MILLRSAHIPQLRYSTAQQAKLPPAYHLMLVRPPKTATVLNHQLSRRYFLLASPIMPDQTDASCKFEMSDQTCHLNDKLNFLLMPTLVLVPLNSYLDIWTSHAL